MKVLAASYNIGAVKALEPVVRLLADKGHHVDYFCSADKDLGNAAPRYLKQQGYPFKIYNNEEVAADMILVGTSASKLSIDKRLTCTAKRKGIPVVGICDFWGSMELRFGDEGEFLPTHVAVIDEVAKEQVEIHAALHYQQLQISITGNPSWDCLEIIGNHYRKENVRSEIRKRLKRFGVGDINPLIFFASQPITLRYGNHYHGYTEKDVLKTLIEVLPKDVDLAIKLHPSESPEEIKEIVKHRYPIFTEEDGVGLYELLAASDIAISMFSTTLIEAIGMGTQALSIEMGVSEKKFWPDYLSESGRLITSKEAIVPTIRKLLDSVPRESSLEDIREKINMDGHATKRVVDFICQAV